MEFGDTRGDDERSMDEQPSPTTRETVASTEPEDEIAGVDAESGAKFEAEFASALGGRGRARGLETRRQRAMIAAALFDEPVTPVKIGRFTIVRELGAGGMGVVYVAYDEQLDRRVAVKLLRGPERANAQRRLEREAQAMARLSHPNVVTVHEVGTFEAQVFVAMEFVDGEDLRGWLKRESNSWRAIIEVFVQAGEGLAAAHDAGIVHRDFKPDNVLVGKDGRVRVADFGLAHAFDAPLEPRESDSSGSQSNRLNISMTRTGAVMGTPAYMPSEQYAGQRTDARSDQFSFCVALWEGLYGRRPFSGANLASLSLAISEGRINPPPEPSEVPSWIATILSRGLSADPDDRWPSMRALLDAILEDPTARRRRLSLRVGVALASTILVGSLVWVSASELRHNARQAYWNGLTEQLLEIERERGLGQANDDAQRARDATRMSVYRRYRPSGGGVEHEDPTVAAALLHEVEGVARQTSEWISAANETLGRSISYAVLRGHRDGVSSLLFSPDGAWLYSGSFDGEVRRWRVDGGAGELIYTHAKHVTKLVLTPDAQWLASSSYDGTVRLSSLVDPGRSRVIATHEQPVRDVAIDPSGRWLASASKDGTAQLHDLRTGRFKTLVGHDGAVYGVSFDAAGTRLLTTSQDFSAKLWRVEDGELLATFTGHTEGVFHGRILAGNAVVRVITGSDDGTALLHTLEAGSGSQQLRLLARHDAPITSLDIHGSKVVTAATDGTMLVSSIGGEAESVVLPPHADGTWAVVFTPDGEQVASASFDGTARLTRADGRGVPREFVGHRLSVFRAVVDSSGSYLATGSYDTTVRLWELARPRLEIPLVGHTDTVFTVESDPSGDRIVTASHDGTVRLWHSREGTALATLDSGLGGQVNHARFGPGGDVVGVARSRHVVELWDLEQGERRVLEGHDDAVWRVAFDGAGERIASASFDDTARIWSTRTDEPPLVVRGHQDKVTCVEFSPLGDRLITASHDGTVRFWDARTGAALTTLNGHTGKISRLVRSPDGHTLATASDDGSVRLWPDEVEAHAIVLAGHDKHVWSVAFDRAGQRVLTGSFDHQIKVWSVADGVLLRTLSGHTDAVWAAEFGPNEQVISISNDHTVRVWSLDSVDPPIVLSGHASGLTSLLVSADGQRIVSASSDGTVELWWLDRLIADPTQLYEQLGGATLYCLSVDERMLELGEDARQAAVARRSCEQTHIR